MSLQQLTIGDIRRGIKDLSDTALLFVDDGNYRYPVIDAVLTRNITFFVDTYMRDNDE